VAEDDDTAVEAAVGAGTGTGTESAAVGPVRGAGSDLLLALLLELAAEEESVAPSPGASTPRPPAVSPETPA